MCCCNLEKTAGGQKVKLQPGVYMAENCDNWLDQYKILMKVKETEKLYIFELVEFNSRYSAAHIESMFAKSKRIIQRKGVAGHTMCVWSDTDFTIYPFQAGIPYYFKKLEEGSI